MRRAGLTELSNRLEIKRSAQYWVVEVFRRTVELPEIIRIHPAHSHLQMECLNPKSGKCACQQRVMASATH